MKIIPTPKTLQLINKQIIKFNFSVPRAKRNLILRRRN